MQAYTGFAMVYDIFMDNVPYDEWTEYLTMLLKEQGVTDGLILELGCGTGNITRRLRDKGYDMIGIDNSYEMLEIARDREYEELYSDIEFDDDSYDPWMEDYEISEEAGADKGYEGVKNNSEIDSIHSEELVFTNKKSSILYLEQDMREFELFGTVKAIVSICDSINYITTKEDLLKVFKLVNNYLDKDGIFIFDMNTEYKYKEILGESTIAENRDDCSFIWENYYNPTSKINEYQVTIYVKSDMNEYANETVKKDYYERFEETHHQRAYSIDEVKELLKEASLDLVGVYDAFTKEPASSSSERVYFVAKEAYQKNKKYVTN